VIKLATDENFDGDIVRGLLRRQPDLDIVRVQDAGLAATPDAIILAWAAAEGRVLLTHDRDTIPNFAYDRVRAGEPIPGVFLVSDRMPKGQAVEELFVAVHCLTPEECENRVTYFPL
jgi:predicted nuclease of predicted toxin-antitoxin system